VRKSVLKEREMEQARALAFVKRPIDWPLWPRLPMKRGEQNRELATLYPTGPQEYTLFLTDAFSPITNETPKIEYPTAEAVLADGWRVD
jgi:hypothetical protein